MTKKQALQIATNFFTYKEGREPQDMIVKSQEGNKFTMRVSSRSTDEVVYEIEVDPACDGIVMREIVAEYKASDFMQQPKKLSELKEGDLFRNEGCCVIWKYYGQEEQYGQMMHGVTREKGGEIFWQTYDTTVYPCGK